MMKNERSVRKMEIAVLRRDRADYARNVQVVEALYREAVALGAFPPQDPLSGLEADIRIARAINSVSKTP